jgi:cAMP phosphodiesterase
MNIRVLGAFGGEGPGQRPSAFLVNERTLVDAGSVAGGLSLPEQLSIDRALVTHAHLDHVVGAAYLAETLATIDARRAFTLFSLPDVVDALRTGLFNNVIWPDFAAIPREHPAVAYESLTAGTRCRVGDLDVIAVPVNHTVPAAGFIVHDGVSGFVYSGDTGPTDALWQAAREVPGIRAVLLECAFPNRLAALADISRHMTPDRVREECRKMPRNVPVLIYHVKPPFFDETSDQLAKLGADITVVEQDKTYTI